MTSPAPAPARPSTARAAVLWGGLLGGLGDFFFAFCFYGWKIRVFQSVAAGLVGREAALAGGYPTFALGVGLHFLIAVTWAALFWALVRRFPALLRHAAWAGLGYGVVIFYGMNSVVLPLSALHTPAWPPAWPWVAPWPLAGHMLLVGLPIALAARRATRRAAAATG